VKVVADGAGNSTGVSLWITGYCCYNDSGTEGAGYPQPFEPAEAIGDDHTGNIEIRNPFPKLSSKKSQGLAIGRSFLQLR
jgi:hypothetical protein